MHEETTMKTHDPKSGNSMAKNRQPENSSILGFGEVPENLDPAFSTHPSIKHSNASLECARMDEILARTLLHLDHGLWTLPPES